MNATSLPGVVPVDVDQPSRLVSGHMLQEIEQLLVIQDRDQKLHRYHREIEAAPLKRAQLEQALENARLTLEKSKEQSKHLEVERKRLELDVQSKEQSMDRLKNQQLQTKKNEEYQALSHEISRHEEQVRELEDRELELMEQAESLKPVIAQAEKEFAESRTSVQDQLSDLDAKVVAIKEQVDQLEADKQRLASELDPDLFDRYSRLMKSKGDAAIVPIESGICSGCHMKVTTTTALKAKSAREVVHCDNCGRMLFVAND